MLNIANTTITELTNNGTLLGYDIKANEGYVLHDKNLDTEVIDEETAMPTGEILLGYRPPEGSCGVHKNYDFSATTVIDGYTAHGPREFFARPQSEVPADQIFAITNPNPPVEVMGETEPETI